MWNEGKVVDRVFVMGLAVGDDRRQRRLAARSRGGGNCHQQGQPSVDMQKPFHLPYTLPRLYDPGASAFAAVHRGTATERDDSLCAIGQIKRSGSLHIVDCRIRHRLIIDTTGNFPLLQRPLPALL